MPGEDRLAATLEIATRLRLRRAVLTLLLAVSACLPAAAQSPEPFYRGKTISILLGHPPGGSYDLYARLAADHLRRFVPGSPNIVVQYKPGGGGVSAVQFFYAQAPRDGTMLGLFTETIGHTQILQPEIGKWKVEAMAYVGSFAPSNAALVVRKGAPATTAAAMRTAAITVGCTGVNSQSYQYPASLKSLGGFRFTMVCGYPGSAEVILALHRGEIDMFSGSWHVWRATQKPALDDGSLMPAIQGGLVRSKDLPEVPLMQELVDDARTKRTIEFISAGSAIGRALIAPPGVPDDRIAMLRAAFDQVVRDPVFLADAAKRSADVEPAPGLTVQGYSDAIAKAPPEVIAAAARAMAAEKN
jgi:tripartite-type tricarboxylate transporter receptor subunit TctC